MDRIEKKHNEEEELIKLVDKYKKITADLQQRRFCITYQNLGLSQ